MSTFAFTLSTALLVLYVRTKVDESPAWLEREHKGQQIFETIGQRWPLFVYMIVLMTVFNFFSHGTEDLYPTFLQVQRKFPQPTVAAIAIIYNIGGILGALCFGTFSERIGRRRTICVAALLALPIIPLWAFAPSPFWLAVGAFVMQFLVQELAREEGALLAADTEYPIWSPYDSFEAADALLHALPKPQASRRLFCI